MKMKRAILLIPAMILFLGIIQKTVTAQTPVTDVGAGVQREALWAEEKTILSKIDWYNVLIKVLNGDIKGLTSDLLGIDQKMLESLQKVSSLIKDYKRIKDTKDILKKIMKVYTQKVPKLVQDKNFTNQQAAVIVQSFDLILNDSKELVSTVLNTILKDNLFLMDDKQRYDTINEIYLDVRHHYGTICYLYNKLLYASYLKSQQDGSLESFAFYYSLYK